MITKVNNVLPNSTGTAEFSTTVFFSNLPNYPGRWVPKIIERVINDLLDTYFTLPEFKPIITIFGKFYLMAINIRGN